VFAYNQRHRYILFPNDNGRKREKFKKEKDFFLFQITKENVQMLLLIATKKWMNISFKYARKKKRLKTRIYIFTRKLIDTLKNKHSFKFTNNLKRTYAIIFILASILFITLIEQA